jgi:hypothetical protein
LRAFNAEKNIVGAMGSSRVSDVKIGIWSALSQKRNHVAEIIVLLILLKGTCGKEVKSPMNQYP